MIDHLQQRSLWWLTLAVCTPGLLMTLRTAWRQRRPR